MTRRERALGIWRAGVESVKPEPALRAVFDPAGPPRSIAIASIERFERILVVGAGKGATAMARALEERLEKAGVPPGRVDGVVNVPDDTLAPLRSVRAHPSRPTGPNLPTEAGVEGAQAMLALARKAGPRDLMICLICGGASALLPAPVPSVPLADKVRATEALHRCGATIVEINAVRKHLSLIKGGGLALAFAGERVLSLLISDVIGDRLDTIGSGPTAVDDTTFADALRVLDRYGIAGEVPGSVLEHLHRGARGEEPETLKRWPQLADGSDRIENLIVASNATALAAATARAEAIGYRAINLGGDLLGETDAVAREMAARLSKERAASEASPLCILSGGETTVTLPPDHGLGGRNQEFVLAMVDALGHAGLRGATVLSAGTDGEDGPTDAAGAIADTQLLAEAASRGLSPRDFLRRHDAYHFFEPLGGLIKTGFTGTNVMDLRVVLSEARERYDSG